MDNVCVVPECGRKLRYKAKRLCGRCYQRIRNYGDASSDRRRRNASHYEALLSFGFALSGECLMSMAYREPMGYRVLTASQVKERAHRTAWKAWFGAIPPDMVVDHECHNAAARAGICAGGNSCEHRSCVNPAHLRLRTIGENVKAARFKNG